MGVWTVKKAWNMKKGSPVLCISPIRCAVALANRRVRYPSLLAVPSPVLVGPVPDETHVGEYHIQLLTPSQSLAMPLAATARRQTRSKQPVAHVGNTLCRRVAVVNVVCETDRCIRWRRVAALAEFDARRIKQDAPSSFPARPDSKGFALALVQAQVPAQFRGGAAGWFYLDLVATVAIPVSEFAPVPCTHR